ncbi:MAG: 3'-5' exonuclease, partial [Halothiobacillaceae bacterium]|nr:3'-5' exonuclease [Halothiobacillaceae bacterium]
AERKEAKERMEELLGALADAPSLESALHACRDIPAPHYPERDWRVLDALLHLLKLAVAELNVSFGAQGMVDFVENALAAQRALGEEDEASELWLALDYRLRHILIDEFQDTSTTQFELLKRLTAGWQAGEDAFTEYEGRSLFLVGDPMQSIYRFREAEVGLFLLAQRAGVGQLRLKRLELCTNFRSQAGIVAWVNRVFAEVLPQSDDLDIGAVRYAEPPAVAFHPEAEGVAVRLHFLPKADARHDALHIAGDEDSESAPAERGRAEAERVIEQVREALATLVDDGTHMKAADRSVAILVRSRSHLAQIIPVLRAAGIAFQAVEIEQLAERPMVHDLMALTRALLHPADRIAWLAVLRAPWCGLRLADLLALVEDQPKSAVWTLLHDTARLERLTPDARARLLHVREVLAVAQAASGRSSLRRQVEGAWLALSGAACAQQARELDEAGIFFDLLDTLHDEQGGVIEVAELEQRLTRLFAPPDSPTPGTPPVQVMTIHKSKGLQFHTVILPSLARTPPNPDSPLLLWREREAASAQGAHPNLLLAPIKAAGDDKPSKKAPPSLYRWLQKMEAARERYETGRLLYVATTRAIQRLHLIAEVPQDKDGAWKAPARSLLGSLWPGIQTGIQLMQENAPPALARQTVESEDVGDTLQAAANATILRRLAQIGTAPRPPAGIVVQSAKRAAKPSSHSAQNDEETYPNAGTQLGVSDETPRHIGTLLHRLFERIAHDGLAAWDARLKEDASATLNATLRSTLRRELLRFGVGAQRLEEAVESVLAALVSTLNDPRGRWILDAHEAAQCEWALGGLIDGQPISAIIDRSFIDHGTRWIIDYKTAVPAAAWGENMDSFLDGQYTFYRAQLESYAALLRNVEPEREIRLGLYFPMLARWLEWSVNDY